MSTATLSDAPRYDFTIAISRVGDPDCREQGTIMNCPLSSVLLQNTFLQAELVNRLVAKLNKRLNPPGFEDGGEIKFEGEVTVMDLTAGSWPPGKIQQELV